MKIICLLMLLANSVYCSSLHATSIQHWLLTEPSHAAFNVRLIRDVDEMDKLSLSQNNIELFSGQVTNAEFIRACHNPKTNLPTIIINTTLEGVGIDQVVALNHSTHWQLLTLASGEQTQIIDNLPCQKIADSRWQVNSKQLDCQCDFSGIIHQKNITTQWYKLLEGFTAGLSHYGLSQLTVTELANQQLTEDLIRDAINSGDVTYNVTKGKNHWLIIESDNGVYQSYSIGLVKQGAHWGIWYYATANSKAFHSIIIDKQSAPSTLNVTICVDDCAWWGKTEQIQLNLATLKIQPVL